MLVSFFLLLWIPGKKRAKLKKLFNLNSILTWEAQYSNTQNKLIIFLSAIAVMYVISWIEDISCFTSDCRNSFNCQLKKFINGQVNIYYSPANVLSLSDESIQIKHFKDHTVIGMYSLFIWFNLQILNFC